MTIPGASFLAARTRSAPQGFGRPIPRKEDARLVTGRGRFSDDFNPPGQAHAHLVRSPHAHARVLSIDGSVALAMPGVLAVLTGRDAAADGLASIPHKPVPTNPNEFPLGGRESGRVLVTPHAPLATDTVRFAGEAVAMVIAETAAAAADAAEAARHPGGPR
jgi:carbon-monoxide dehydrogenase large subunit